MKLSHIPCKPGVIGLILFSNLLGENLNGGIVSMIIWPWLLGGGLNPSTEDKLHHYNRKV